jgi:hypothetical protein
MRGSVPPLLHLQNGVLIKQWDNFTFQSYIKEAYGRVHNKRKSGILASCSRMRYYNTDFAITFNLDGALEKVSYYTELLEARES